MNISRPMCSSFPGSTSLNPEAYPKQRHYRGLSMNSHPSSTALALVQPSPFLDQLSSSADQSNVLAASALPLLDDSSLQHSLQLTRSIDQFSILQELGNGSFGSVFKAIHKPSGEMVAIKKMKKKFSTQGGCRSLQEVKALERLRAGPNIVTLHHFFLDKKELHMVFELMDGNLYQMIKDRTGAFLEEERIRSMVFQVLRGLHHMHSNGIMHRDMKPENLLITGDIVKIADFGLAREIKSKPPYTTYVSTRWYRAPEVLLKSSNYSCAVDLWAIGTIAAELITLKPLFPGVSDVDQMNRICTVLGTPAPSAASPSPPSTVGPAFTGIGGEWKDGMNLASRMGISFAAYPLKSLQDLIPNGRPFALHMISSLLRYDPKNRSTAYQALHSPWFSDMAETLELTELTDIQHSPDKRRTTVKPLVRGGQSNYAMENVAQTLDLKDTAMLASGFDLPEISPISPFWNDS
ncbi:hypothetical protein BG005_004985 [Podila minutissima]|nr:hypothetical protein BG005_004985 [Podila minutissima]